MLSPSSVDKRENGFSLVAVLGFLLLVSSILLPLSISSHTRLLSAKYDLDQAQLDMILESTELAIKTQWKRGFQTSGNSEFTKSFVCQFPDISIRAELRELGGLIDLNGANERLLAIGFQAIGITDSSASVLARSVLAYRSRNTQFQIELGVEPSGGFKNGLFETVAELHDFESLRSLSLHELQRVFTVHNRSASINYTLASADLKEALDEARRNGFDLPFMNTGTRRHRGLYIHVGARFHGKAWTSLSATLRVGTNGNIERLDQKRQIMSDFPKLNVVSPQSREICSLLPFEQTVLLHQRGHAQHG